MRKLTVELPGRQYDIIIGGGLLQQAGQNIKAFAKGSRVAVVTDDTVWAHYGDVFGRSLKEAGVEYFLTSLLPGEQSKTLESYGRVQNAFAEGGLLRSGLVVAFGGGVVGDLAGFAAATYMRGVDYIQIPTTLLAQVDSSVGGKTAIDLPGGKNLVGAFYQPKLVLADTSVLATLTKDQFSCGMAEVVKYGAIRSKEFFDSLAQPLETNRLDEVVEQCCQIKSEIVNADELDKGERMLLNFGHTFGHAIEVLGGYNRFNHGQGVAIGMVLAARVGEAAGLTPKGTAAKLVAVLEAQGLPVASPWAAAELLPKMALDKKNMAGGLNMILLPEIGRAMVVTKSMDEVKLLLEEVDHCSH